jgi:hypothetical protein
LCFFCRYRRDDREQRPNAAEAEQRHPAGPGARWQPPGSRSPVRLGWRRNRIRCSLGAVATASPTPSCNAGDTLELKCAA